MAPPVGGPGRVDQYYHPTTDSNQEATTQVQIGETTIADVARRLKMSPDDLLAANPQVKDPYHLSVQQELQVPPHDDATAFPGDSGSAADAHKTPSSVSPGKGDDAIAASVMKGALNATAAAGKAAIPQAIAPHESGNIDAQGRMTYENLRKFEQAYHTYETTGKVPPSLKDLDDDTLKNHGYVAGPKFYAGSQDKKNSLESLKNYMTDPQGRPFTDFEKNLISEYGKNPEMTVTPLWHMAGNGINAYAVTRGGSGDRITNYYDSEGKHLAGPFHYEAGLVNEGLGPIDYIGGALAVKALAKGLISRAAGKVIGAETAAGAAVKAVGRSEGEAGAGAVGKAAGRAEGDASVAGGAQKSGGGAAGASRDPTYATSTGDVMINPSLGELRELRVAEETGGKVAKQYGKKGRPSSAQDLKLPTGTGGSVKVDVLGPKGELVNVYGPGEVNKMASLGDELNRLKQAAAYRGVKAQAYFEEGTDQKVLDLAKKILGADNVHTFK